MPSNQSASNRRRTRAEAARENGRKSKGAVTSEGKFRCATASLKHGLTGKCVVLANECPRKYAAMRDEYFQEWQPQGRTETDLLVAAVNCNWRLQRIWAMESALIDSAMFYKRGEFEESYETPTAAMRAADAVCALNVANKANLETLQRYEVTYSRMYERSLASLRKLRHSRGVAASPGPALRQEPHLGPEPEELPHHQPASMPFPETPDPDSPNPGSPGHTPTRSSRPTWLSFTHILNGLRLLLLLILHRIPRRKTHAAATRHSAPLPPPEPSLWQPHESLSPMPREEFFAEHSGTFTVPEHFSYESEFDAPRHLWIPNGCVGCPACNEREQQEAEKASAPEKTTKRK